MDERMIFRGEVYLVDEFFDVEGSEQHGNRPVLVIQNDELWRSGTVTVAFLTSRMDKKGRRAHVKLPEVEGLWKRSQVLCEQVRSIDKTRLKKKIAELDAHTMNRVDRGLKFSLGLKTAEQKRDWEIREKRKKVVMLDWRTRRARREELLKNAVPVARITTNS